jgi:hypothetical protein
MLIATALAQWVIRVTGVTQLVLGLLFWNRRALALIHVHMLVGMLFVLALLVTAGLAARAGLARSIVALVVTYALAIPIFGYFHPRLFPGSVHWVVQLLHLAVGLGAMVIAAKLAKYIRRHRRKTLAPEAGVRDAA